VNFDVIQLAVEVISRASHDKPADQVLRETFKRCRDLPSFDATEISQLVFTYFRWYGWVADEPNVESRLRRARELAERFEKTPLAFPEENLRTKIMPSWTVDEVQVNEEWLRTLQRQPKLWLRARRGQGTSLARKLGDCRPFSGAMAETLEYFGTKDLFRTPQFHAGEFEVQDISSQVVGFVCQPEAGESWWDTCAGEGGKLLHLSDLMANKGLIWASDRAAWRLQKLKRRAGRAGAFNYRAVLWDGGTKLPTKTKFDGVLVDAPCTGVGTWQRNPHARWTTTLQDVSELSAIQKKLLANAAAAVKPGGKLIYSVCTLTKSETVQVADDFESKFKNFQPLPVANPTSPKQTVSPRLWIWPQESGGNGMFIAAWQKAGAKG
jgi:16S rRNA (cytosine967-C5)-methyltransferase